MSHLRTFKEIIKYCNRYQGVTLRIPSCEIASYKTGYFVSIEGGQIVTHLEFTSDILSDFIIDNSDKLSHGFLLGIWYDKEHVYLDLTKWIQGYSKALSFGRDNKQIAIYDVKNQKVITL